MTCPSEVTHSMYADGALSAHDAMVLERHAASCAVCRARIEALRDESEVLRTALRHTEDLVPIPRFVPPPSARDFVVLIASVVLIGGFSRTFWSTLAAAIPTELKWLNPFESGVLFDRATAIVKFVVFEGPAMWTAALNFVGAALVVAFVAWLAYSTVRHRAFGGIAAALLAVAAALPSVGHAFEIRRTLEGPVTVAADETINDTLLAMGETVSIDGNVNGDLLAFGREVTVRGNVAGNIVTSGQSVTIEGTVGGTVLGAGERVTIENRVGRDFYGFANRVEILSGANVAGNAIGFGRTTVGQEGRVGIDFKGFGNRVTVSGAVERNVDGFGKAVTVESTARIGGNLTGHVNNTGDLKVADGALVGGTVEELLVEREHRRDHNRYLTSEYYLSQVVRLAGLFLTGLVLLWLVPILREVSLPNTIAALRSFGIGLAAAVTLPVAAIIVCFTIVGIPLAILTFVLGAVGLFFSKAVIAQIIGREVLRNRPTPPHYAATLFVGLVIVIVAINLPWIGGLANLILTLTGFGIIVSLIYARVNRDATA